jgi:hypothetical protein
VNETTRMGPMPIVDVITVPAALEAGACIEQVIENVYANEGEIATSYTEAVAFIEAGHGVDNALELLDMFTGRIVLPVSTFTAVEYSTRGRFGAGYGTAYGTFDEAGYGYGSGDYGDAELFTGGGSYGNPVMFASNDESAYGV